MELQNPQLSFPTNFCCNCGDTGCSSEIQHTRVSRFFGIYGTDTTFQLPVPVCVGCRRSTRRRPAGFFIRVLVFAIACGAWWVALLALARSVTLPPLIGGNLWAIGAALGAISALAFYRLRRARPPRTSFYQPVRIKSADVQFSGVMGGPAHIRFMKLAFTNPDYRDLFTDANRDAITARRLAVVKA